MFTIKTTLHENGRIVIPAELRKKLNFSGGDEILITLGDGEIKITSYKSAVKKAQLAVKKYNKNNISLTNALLTMRNEESEHE